MAFAVSAAPSTGRCVLTLSLRTLLATRSSFFTLPNANARPTCPSGGEVISFSVGTGFAAAFLLVFGQDPTVEDPADLCDRSTRYCTVTGAVTTLLP